MRFAEGPGSVLVPSGSQRKGAEHIMFPFWDVVIAPVLDAIGAKRVVEIGALRGETTAHMLDHMGPDAELHVIDPAPDYDVSTWEREYGNRLVYHRALSLDVLPKLDRFDAIFVDGDHSLSGALSDLRNYGPRAARILVHDTDAPDFPGVRQAVDEFLQETKRRVTYYNGSFGMAEIV